MLELHGTVHEVECQDCQHTYSRTWYQGRLDAHNPDWLESAMRQASARPDGDVELPQPAVDSFRIAPCERCGSSYQKPCVVWFGGNVPAKTVEAAKLIAERASAALVLGSTLSTFSAFRLVRAVAEKGKPVGIVNLGATRADALSTVVKVEASLAPTLEALLQALEGSASKSTKASTATGTGTGRGHVLGADATLGQGQDMRLGGDRISGVGGEGSRMQVMR